VVSLLLRHLDLPAPAEQIRSAVRAVTYDVCGTATTREAAAVETGLARADQE
jgi:hypothetical protein